MLYASHAHLLKWLLVPLAYLGGGVLAPVLLHTVWELGFLVLPTSDWALPVIETIKSGLGGFCSVYFAGAVAPRGKTIVATVCCTASVVLYLTWFGLTVPFSSVFFWSNVIVLCVLSVIAAVVTARQERSKLPLAHADQNADSTSQRFQA